MNFFSITIIIQNGDYLHWESLALNIFDKRTDYCSRSKMFNLPYGCEFVDDIAKSKNYDDDHTDFESLFTSAQRCVEKNSVES